MTFCGGGKSRTLFCWPGGTEFWLIVELNLQHMQVGVFGIEYAIDFHSLAFEAVNEVRAIEMVDISSVFAGHEDQIAAEVLDAVLGAGGRSAAHRLGFEHLLMRAGQGMDVQGALAVGNFSVKEASGAGWRIVRLGLNKNRCDYYCRGAENLNVFHGVSCHEVDQGSTVNFICMPSWSSLQITVQTTSYSPGSAGAVR